MANNPYLIAGLIFVAAIAWGALFTPGMVLLSSGADGVGLPQGLAFGIMNGGWALGAIVGPAVGGLLSDVAGDVFAYGLGALACGARVRRGHPGWHSDPRECQVLFDNIVSALAHGECQEMNRTG